MDKSRNKPLKKKGKRKLLFEDFDEKPEQQAPHPTEGESGPTLKEAQQDKRDLATQQPLPPVMKCIAIYFLKGKLKPEIVGLDGKTPIQMASATMGDNFFVGHVLVPHGQEFCFKIRIPLYRGTLLSYENDFKSRCISATDVFLRDALVFENFDSVLGYNTLQRVNTFHHFTQVAISFSELGDMEIIHFEEMTHYAFQELAKVYQRTAYSQILYVDIKELVGLLKSPKAERFVRTIILCQSCTVPGLKARFIDAPLNDIKDSRSFLTEYPRYFILGKQHAETLFGTLSRKFFFLMAAICHPSQEERQEFARLFRANSSKSFTDYESNFLKEEMTRETSDLTPSDFCSCLAMANQLGIMDDTIPALLSTQNGRHKEYQQTLLDFNWESYLTEWAWYLKKSPPVPVDAIPFSLNSSKFRSLSTLATKKIDELLVYACDSKESIWRDHFLNEMANDIRRKAENPNIKAKQAFYINGILRILSFAKEPEQVKLFHKMLPKDSEGFMARIANAQKLSLEKSPTLAQATLYGLEIESLLKILKTMPLDGLLELRPKLKLDNPFIRDHFYPAVWELTFNSLLPKDYPLSRQGIVNSDPNDSTPSDLFWCLESDSITDLFISAREKKVFPDRLYRLGQDAERFMKHIETENVILQILKYLQNEKLQSRFHAIYPRFSIKSVTTLYEQSQKYINDWNSLLDALKIMEERDQFTQEAQKLYQEYFEQRSNLQNEPIKNWVAPACHPQLPRISQKLSALQKSVFFKLGWDKLELGRHIKIVDPKKLTGYWVEYVEIYIEVWKGLLQQIELGDVPSSTIRTLFPDTAAQAGVSGSMRLVTKGEAEIRKQMHNLSRGYRDRLEITIQYELQVATELVGSRLEFNVVFELIDFCINALDMLEDMGALKKTYIELSIPIDPILTNFCSLCDSKQDPTCAKVVVAYRKLANLLPNLTLVIRGYPTVFYEMMFTRNMLKDLQPLTVKALNGRISNRQSEDLREETQNNLTSLRVVGQSIMSHPLWDQMKLRSAPINPQEFWRFLSETGVAMAALSLLRSSKEPIAETLKAQTEEKQTIAIVYKLLREGALTIDVKNGKATISAELSRLEEAEDKVWVSPEELEALPSQLLLTSGVTTDAQDVDVDGELPPDIATAEDRKPYVLRFNKLFDIAFGLTRVVQLLCQSGHPKYQSNTLTVPCTVNSQKFIEFLNSQQEELEQWMASFATSRQAKPNLSFLSRSQLVACLAGLRNKDRGALYSTLQCVGCNPDPAVMGPKVEAFLHRSENLRSRNDLFEILSDALEELFQGEKLTQHTAKGQALGFLTLKDKPPFSLIRIPSDSCSEEVVCGAHISFHQRAPSSLEVLFCRHDTTDIDVQDFIERWVLFQSTTWGQAAQPIVTFWLVDVENLPYSTQTSCMQKISQIGKMDSSAPKLFFLTRTDNSHLSSALLRRTETLSHKMCSQLSDLIFSVASGLKNVYVAHSQYCGEGKTESAIKQLVCDKSRNGEAILHTQISIDTTPMETQLRRLSDARKSSPDLGLVLHFNIGHQGKDKEINLFLFQYLLMGCWRDDHGYTFPRHRNDTIVVELCNTGRKDERQRITICRYLKELKLDSGISHYRLQPIPSEFSNLFYSFTQHTEFQIGTQMLVALYKAMCSGATTLGSYSNIETIEIPNENGLWEMVSALGTENFCPKKHLMQDRSLPGTHACSKCQNKFDPNDVSVFCSTCNYGLCPLCMKTAPSKSKVIFLRRFFRFAASQLQSFYYAFQGFWMLEEFDEQGAHYPKIAYHYARFIVRSAQTLAKPAVAPYDIENHQDDVERCKAMDKFESWRETPFFLSSNTEKADSHYTALTTAKDSIYDFIMRNEINNDPEFFEWLRQTKAMCPSIDRAYLHSLCEKLSHHSTPYSSDHINPPFKDLLDVLGCFNGAYPLLKAMSTIRDMNYGSRFLEEVQMEGGIPDGLEYLSSVSPNEKLVNCVDFQLAVGNYICKLFGTDSKKPLYTLTADNILRMITIQLRLMSGIPVCIMGETGCGKTESISFLSRISGMSFHIINIQEGMMEPDLYELMEPIITKANNLLHQRFVVLLDEVNATRACWVAKDMLCDHICYGVRLPPNIVFVVILNPWKERTAKQRQAITEMDVGGLDFLKYQQANAELQTQQNHNLVYQVHKVPETLYSLVWDWGSSCTTKTPLPEIKNFVERHISAINTPQITDELLMASSMVSWLIRKLQAKAHGLTKEFENIGKSQAGGGNQFWYQFRTLFVKLLLASQEFIRHDVYLDEISSVSLRDIRKACELLLLVFFKFEHAMPGTFSYVKLLKVAIQTALIQTYCLRLDTQNRYKYVTRIEYEWTQIRNESWHEAFLNIGAGSPPSFDESELYRSFDELAGRIAGDLDIDSGIAVNQALKENTFALLCAVLLKSTLFIVGRPGSTKSRTLELLCKATEDISKRPESFFAKLGITIQIHVIQCSPYTTAHHMHSNAKRAARAQISADGQKFGEKRVNVIVMEEVGATIGSAHNPLMSLHSMIDHGIEVDGKYIKLPIIGISNYRLDASKMGRGRVVYRGNPLIKDLDFTAREILRGLEAPTNNQQWISSFAHAFSQQILENNDFTWYHGMRDFYATVSSMRNLAVPLENTLKTNLLSGRAQKSQVNSHVARWAVLINLRGYPEEKKEMGLAESMLRSFGLQEETNAQYEWNRHDGSENMYLCNCCCKMQMYRLALEWESKNPQETITKDILGDLFRQHASPIHHANFCQYFEKNQFLPAPEVISYSLREHASRHVMIFTKANAALFLLFSMKLVKKDQCTVIFQSTSKNYSTATSELVQQMMRIKACMKEGKTLILVKSRHLYESLLDALNVHYTKDRLGEDDNLHRTVLSMAGVTQSVFVQPSFRCIVLEDQDELKNTVLPPMINRFSKVVLTYASSLTGTQRETKLKLGPLCRVEVEGKTINILQLLIPGFCEETLDSLVCAFDKIDVIRRICFCFSPKNFRRLALKLVEGLNNDAVMACLATWRGYWKQNKCDIDFIDVAQDSLLATSTALPVPSNAMILEDDEEPEEPQHLLVLTEQLQLDPKSVKQTFFDIFCPEDGDVHILPSFHSLNQATSVDIDAALTTLRKTPATDEVAAISIFILDTTAEAQSVQLDSFMYSVSTQDFGPNHHVVLVAITSDFLLNPSSQEKSNFSLVFDSNWAHVYADEIVPRHLIPNQEGSLLPFLEKDVLLHETLTPELIVGLILQTDTLTTLCQSLSDASEVDDNIRLLESLLNGETKLKETILRLTSEHIEKAEIQFSKWSKLALQKEKHSSGSLCSTYLEFLSGFLVRVLFHILGSLMQFKSLKLAEKDDTLSDLLSCLVIDERIVSAPNIENALSSPISSFTKPTDVHSDHSPLIATTLYNFDGNEEQIDNFLRGVQLELLDEDFTNKYIRDVVCNGCGLQPEKFHLLQQIVFIYFPKSFQTIAEFHILLAKQGAWFKVAVAFSQLQFDNQLESLSSVGLLHMASVGGIVPLNRVETLLKLTVHEEANKTNEMKPIDWRIIRAIANIDAIEKPAAQAAQDRKTLQKIAKAFDVGEEDGITELFESNSPGFVKFFLVELYSRETKPTEQTLQTALARISDLGDFTDQGIQCGASFLLHLCLSAIFQNRSSDSITKGLRTFMSAGPQQYLLVCHTAFDIIHSDRVLDINFNPDEFKEQTPIFRLLRIALAVTAIIDLIGLKASDPGNAQRIKTRMDVISKFAVVESDARELTLFLIRQLSSGGAVDVLKAIEIARSDAFPALISKNPILSELELEFRPVSPLGYLPDFSKGIHSLVELNAHKDLTNFKATFPQLDLSTRFAIAGTFCLKISAVPANFNDIFPSLTAEMAKPALDMLAWLQTSPIANTKDETRELVLHLITLLIKNDLTLQVFRELAHESLQRIQQVQKIRIELEECLVPRCPGCKKAFVDWTNCFAVTCTCGQGFCGFCLLPFQDPHGHIYTVHANVPPDFRLCFSKIAIQNLKNVLANVPLELKAIIEDEIPRILNGPKGNLWGISPAQITQGAPRNPADPVRIDISPVASIMLQILSQSGYLWNRITVPNSSADPLPKIIETIEGLVQRINTALFPTASTLGHAYSWIHAALAELCSQNLFGVATRNSCQDRVIALCQNNPNPTLFLVEFDKKCRKGQNAITKELQISATTLLETQPFSDSVKLRLACLHRSQLNFEQIWAHIAANYETYPVLNFLHDKSLSIHPNSTFRTLRMVQFMAMLQNAVKEKRIEFSHACLEGSLFQFIEDYGGTLEKEFVRFKKDFAEAFKTPLQWECKNISKEFSVFQKGLKKASLECFIPYSRDSRGILALALWAGREEQSEQDFQQKWVGLPQAQNQLYQILHDLDPNNPPKSILPYSLTENDIIAVDPTAIQSVISSLFIVPGYQPQLSADLTVMESLVKYGSMNLAALPFLRPQLPNFDWTYGTEGLIKLLEELQQRYSEVHPFSFTTLPNAFGTAVSALITRTPYAARLIFAYCSAILFQSDNTNRYLEVDRIPKKMQWTQEQVEGKRILSQIPNSSATFLVSHLPALMGLCWSKNIELPQFIDEPMDDEQLAKDIEHSFGEWIPNKDGKPGKYQMQIASLLAAMRICGIRSFTTEANHKADIFYYLAYEIIVAPLFDEPDYDVALPFSVEMRYFGYVLRTAERLLGPYEFAQDIGVQDLSSTVVPFSVIRPFLQDQKEEESDTSDSEDEMSTEMPPKKIGRVQEEPQIVKPAPKPLLPERNISVSWAMEEDEF